MVGPRWERELCNGKIRWIANACRTHLGPLAGEGLVDLRVVEERASCWMGHAFVWPTVEHRWDDLRSVTVRPGRVKHVGWWKAEKAMRAMEDLLHGRPEADGLTLRVEPRATTLPAGRPEWKV